MGDTVAVAMAVAVAVAVGETFEDGDGNGDGDGEDDDTGVAEGLANAVAVGAIEGVAVTLSAARIGATGVLDPPEHDASAMAAMASAFDSRRLTFIGKA